MPLALKTYPTIAEAGSALKGEGARYLGGGTLVVRAANEGDLSLSTFVRSTDPTLTAIEVEGGRATLGASVTMSAIARHPGLTAIAKAAQAVGGPAIRNMATVGGNLFAPAPYGDFAVALLALDATVRHRPPARWPIDDFLAGRERQRLVAAVSFAASDGRNIPLPEGVAHQAEGRLGAQHRRRASTPTPARCSRRESRSAAWPTGRFAPRPPRRRSIGATLDEQGIASAVAAVGEGTEPITDAIASAWYRGEVLPVHFRRLLLG